jgi:hypothetical protein
MTKPSKRHDETWAIGKGLSLWNNLNGTNKGIIYAEEGLMAIEITDDRTQIDVILHGRLHRRIISKAFAKEKAVAEAHRFARSLLLT